MRNGYSSSIHPAYNRKDTKQYMCSFHLLLMKRPGGREKNKEAT